MEYVNVIMLKRWVDEIKEQMDKVGIVSGNIEHVTINRNAHSFWGRCSRVRGKANTFNIQVTSDLLLCDEKQIKETLAHELVHTCEGCLNHGENFKRIAYIMNTTYKYNIKRTTSIEEKGLSVAETRSRSKYLLVCTQCGNKNYFGRKTNSVKNYKNCICSLCNGKLKLIEL